LCGFLRGELFGTVDAGIFTDKTPFLLCNPRRHQSLGIRGCPPTSLTEGDNVVDVYDNSTFHESCELK